MQKSFLSKGILGLLLTALFSQNMIAMAPTAMTPEKRSAMVQLQVTIKRFDKAIRSFARCAATGECDSEHQKKLVAEIGNLTKQLLRLIAVVGIIGGAALLARRKAISDLQKLKTEVNQEKKKLIKEFNAERQNIEADVESRVDAALAKYKPIVEESVNTAVTQSVDYAKAAIKSTIDETITDVEKRIKDAAERTDIIIPSVVKGGTAQVLIKPAKPVAPTNIAEPEKVQGVLTEHEAEREALFSKKSSGAKNKDAEVKQPLAPKPVEQGNIVTDAAQPKKQEQPKTWTEWMWGTNQDSSNNDDGLKIDRSSNEQ